MQFITRLIADGTLIPIVLIGLYALTYKVPAKSRYAAYSRVLMAGLTTLLVAKYMATLWQPTGERPFQILGVAPGAAYLPNPGFPSDHAILSASILYAVWFETRSKLWTRVLVVLVLLVCVGRVLALVHTPMDILGGLIAATVGAIWYFTPRIGNDLPKRHKRAK
ncbi:MAG: phosphatase PAP2 family protein [Candidatus Nomurabacteria bacterium]|nr:MAG: phosphatase PAP2 family protein [Candidatus Nomurabacteria bacterium]